MQAEEKYHSPQIAISSIRPQQRNRDHDETFINIVQNWSNEMHHVRTFEKDVLDAINPQWKVQDKSYLSPSSQEERRRRRICCWQVPQLTNLLDYWISLVMKGLDWMWTHWNVVPLSTEMIYLVSLMPTRNCLQQKRRCSWKRRISQRSIICPFDIITQKGMFHQLVHQATVIYTKYYGRFIQAIQVALAMKRVKGDPVKSNDQDHDKFMLKMYQSTWGTLGSTGFISISSEARPNTSMTNTLSIIPHPPVSGMMSPLMPSSSRTASAYGTRDCSTFFLNLCDI